MLRINLLPQDYREAERKPLGAYLVMALCTVLAVSSIGTTAYMYFAFLKAAETAKEIAKEKYENLAPMAEYADQLDKEKQEYMKRSKVIKEIESARIMWTKKLDQMLDVVNNKGDIEEHWVWLKDMKITTGGSRVNGMSIKGFTVGDQYETLSNFNEDLKNHEMFKKDFVAISNPTGSIVTEKKMEPPTAIEFAWDLKLKENE